MKKIKIKITCIFTPRLIAFPVTTNGKTSEVDANEFDVEIDLDGWLEIVVKTVIGMVVATADVPDKNVFVPIFKEVAWLVACGCEKVLSVYPIVTVSKDGINEVAKLEADESGNKEVAIKAELGKLFVVETLLYFTKDELWANASAELVNIQDLVTRAVEESFGKVKVLSLEEDGLLDRDVGE